MKPSIPKIIGRTSALGMMALAGCTSTVKHKSGQVELFYVHPVNQMLLRSQSVQWEELFKDIAPHDGRELTPKFGDRVKHNTDVITLNVRSIYLDQLPASLTGSHDIVVFAEIWENSVDRSNEGKLTSVVFAQPDQLIPGRLNFDGNIAYGPTIFKGFPITIKFTVMVLQKRAGEQQGAVAAAVGKAAEAIPTYGILVSQAANVMRDILKAQPDIVAFEYEATLLADAPTGTAPTLLSDGPSPALAAEATHTVEMVKSALNEATTGTSNSKQTEINSQVGKLFQAKAASRARVSTATAKSWFSISTNSISGFDLDKFTSALGADPGTNENLLSRRRGWLNYGIYTLLETEQRQANAPSTKSTSSSVDAVSLRHTGIEAYDPDKSYVYDGGWIYEAAELKPAAKTGGRNEFDVDAVNLNINAKFLRHWPQRIRNKYIVFEVTPGQIEEDKEVLRAASKAHAKTLADLQQTDGNLAQVTKTLDDSVTSVKNYVLKAKTQRQLMSEATSESIKVTKDLTEEKAKKLTISLQEKLDRWATQMGLKPNDDQTKAMLGGFIDEAMAKLRANLSNP